ncbi:MAG: hypothetical protein IT167_00765 [Bryobacterales bacterium]|nr:hypothetical protein [Bryobacterales bacterium]
MPHKLLATLLAGALALPAQQTTPASSLVSQGGGLKIVVVSGEGAANQIRTRSAVAPVVEIRNDKDQPVAGADVTFQLPQSGPSGFFNGWLRNQTVKTGQDGRAAASGYQPNDEEGRLNMKVTATFGTQTASVVIAQTNVAGSRSSSSAAKSGKAGGWWKIAAVVGAAAIAGGVVAATRGGDSTSVPAKSVGITAGAITVGGPR